VVERQPAPDDRRPVPAKVVLAVIWYRAQKVGVDGSLLALYREPGPCLGAGVRGKPAVGFRADENATEGGLCLEPGRGVDGVAHDGICHVARAAQLTNQGLASVDTDA